MKQKIVAIGGGSIGWGVKKPEVLSISREIIKLAGKKNPKFLFVPTASSDDRAYARLAANHFGRKMGCRFETMFLCRENPSPAEIKRRVLASDIIYVGGGNTLMMMNRWKRLGMDRALREARRKGKVLCGTSAGALCWFKSGNSDSWKYYNKKAPLIRVAGLGFIAALGCPHYDGEKDREPQLKTMMRKTPGAAIALDNCAALEVVGNKARIITSKPNANGWRIYWKRGKYHKEKLTGLGWMPLSKMINKEVGLH